MPCIIPRCVLTSHKSKIRHLLVKLDKLLNLPLPCFWVFLCYLCIKRRSLLLTQTGFYSLIKETLMRKILVALDDSTSAMRAVEYAGSQFSGIGDLEIALVHVLPNLPAMFWDEGHILNDEEKKERKKVVDKWIAVRKEKIESVFKKASEVLIRAGIQASQIQTKSISDSTDIPASIVETAKDGGYQTILVGRCNHTTRHLLGSVSGKIMNQASGLAVTVIG